VGHAEYIYATKFTYMRYKYLQIFTLVVHEAMKERGKGPLG